MKWIPRGYKVNGHTWQPLLQPWNDPSQPRLFTCCVSDYDEPLLIPQMVGITYIFAGFPLMDFSRDQHIGACITKTIHLKLSWRKPWQYCNFFTRQRQIANDTDCL